MRHIILATLLASLMLMSGCLFSIFGTKNVRKSQTDYLAKYRAEAVESRDNFLKMADPKTKSEYKAWNQAKAKSVKQCSYWKSRAGSDNAERQRAHNECTLRIIKHYVATSYKSADHFIKQNKGLVAHWIARNLASSAGWHGYKIDDAKALSLTQRTAKARVAEMQDRFKKTGAYFEPNQTGCVASLKRLPKGNVRIKNLVQHVDYGQTVYVRCFMPVRLRALQAGKINPHFQATMKTLERGGRKSNKDFFPIDVTQHMNRTYFDFAYKTGKYTVKSQQGMVIIYAGMGWTTGYQRRWNDSYKMWEKYAVKAWKNAEMTLSFGT